MSVIFVTHDLAVVRSISDDVVVMRNGTIREAGPADGVFEAPADAYTQELLAAIPRFQKYDYPGSGLHLESVGQ